jgi:Fic family protein
VDPKKFESSDFGTVVVDDGLGYGWFVPAPIPRTLQLEDQTLLALSRADEALGKLAGVGRLLPNPKLFMGPYAFKEALASARIEGTQAELKEVFTADRRGIGRDDLRMVSDYRRALNEGLMLVGESERLSFAIVCGVHATLMGNTDGPPSQPRTRPVWLGSPTDRPETAVFVPPLQADLTAAIEDWQNYIDRPPAMPTLIRAALLHYQFLTIHPFLDGNGRVGRLLVLLLLSAEQRLPVPLLYLSPYFEERRREYYDRLQAVRERGDIQQWCQFFLTAVEAQANDGVERAASLMELRERYRSELAGSRNRSMEVVEMIFENPVINTAAVREQLNVTTQGALNLIRSIEARGWLTTVGHVGRGGAAMWIAYDVFRTMSEPQPS